MKAIKHICFYLSAILCIVCFLFPMTGKEYAVIRKEIARRKGEETDPATDEEIRICEKVTGFAFDRLWNKENTKLGHASGRTE